MQLFKSDDIKVSVVVPAYNEEKRIRECLDKLYKFFKKADYSYEIVISDDGSKDTTKDIVKNFQKEWPELKLLENKHKGKAPAIISGIFGCKGEYVLFTDVDLSVPITEFTKMYNWVSQQNFDVAIASREGFGSKRVDEPFTRHVMGRVFNYLVQIVLLPGINDTQCGFKLFKRSAIENIFQKTLLYSPNSEEITGGKVSAFDVEILFVARLLNYRIKEVPVTWYYVGDSKVHNVKDSYYNAKDVIKVKLNYLKGLYN